MWLLGTVLTLVAVSEGGGESVVVHTPYGALRGSRFTTPDGQLVHAYRNIPYAQPPVGDLRFSMPVANKPWTGTRNATSLAPSCPQGADFSGVLNFTSVLSYSEDCLYLNVFTPQVNGGSGNLLPVMVWIHGGGYVTGTGSDIDMSAIAMKGVVGVSINYRLAALGFLSTEDAVSPGNYGLFDQIRALEWVRDAISSFNGDPNDVTIFGESAGGSSVDLLFLSPKAKGLFHKAIMQSGSSLNQFAVTLPHRNPDPLTSARELASRLSCDVTNSRDMLACLRTKSLDPIVNVTMQLVGDFTTTTYGFGPVIESSFGEDGLLSDDPRELIRQGLFNNVSVIRGFTSDEAAMGLQDPGDDGFTEEEFRKLTRSFVDLQLAQSAYTVDTDRIFSLLVSTYLGNQTDPIAIRSSYIQWMSDQFMVAPVLKETHMTYLAHAKPQYLFQFSYRSDNSMVPAFLGTPHGDDVFYTLGFPVINMTYLYGFVTSWTDEDRRVADDVTTMWTNFAKYGNPTPDGYNGTKWLPWEQATPRLLDIGRQFQMKAWPISANIHLWNDVIAKLIEPPEAIIG